MPVHTTSLRVLFVRPAKIIKDIRAPLYDRLKAIRSGDQHNAEKHIAKQHQLAAS
jgi:ATP-dependent Lon protease